MARKDRKAAEEGTHNVVTRVDEKRNVTTGQQFPLRLTPLERDALSQLTEKVQKELPHMQVSMSRVLRAAVFLQKDSQVKAIVKAILEGAKNMG
jgi:hypothetical protein